MTADAIPTSTRRDPSTGLWTMTAPPDSLSRPVLHGDDLLLLINGRPCAVDPATGQVRWQGPDQASGVDNPWLVTLAAAGQRLVATNEKPAWFHHDPITLTGFDTTDGTRAWVRDAEPFTGYLVDEPSNTLLLWQYGDDVLHHITAIDLADGTQRWRRTYERVGIPLVVGDHVIVSVQTEKGRGLRAYDVRNGAKLWSNEDAYYQGRLRLGRTKHGRPRVVAVESLGGPVWFDPETGERVGSFRRRAYFNAVRPGTAGRSLWISGLGRTLEQVRPFGWWTWRRLFMLRHPLCHPQGSPIAELEGRIYAVVRPEGDFDQPKEKTHGQALYTARVGGPVRVLRPLRGLGRLHRALAELTPGERHLYVTVLQESGYELLAIRAGRARWRRAVTHRGLLPLGDRLLVIVPEEERDLLCLVDGDSGEGLPEE